jgi:integrase
MLPDGRRTNRSTGTSNLKDAQRIANKFEDASKEASQGRLVEARARQTIADIFAIGNKDQLPSSTTKHFFTSWLKRKELEAAEKTHVRYEVAVRQFMEFLGTKVTKDVSHLSSKDIAAFRDSLGERLSAGTANISLKIVRAALNQAKRDGLIDQNEADRVTLLKRVRRMERRPFTLPELKKIWEVANDEWKGMILFGLYTGLRLGDIANLTWANLDLSKAEVTVVTSKTGRIQILPLAPPLLRHVSEMPSSDNPQQPLFPKANECYEKNYFNGALSKQFYQILVNAGFAKPRKAKETGQGGSVKHTTNDLSFHCLRHTATSLLKNAGVSDVVARDIIGHDSEAVSRQYTHIDMATKRNAVALLPDVLK